jgi:hypothetical protein
MSVTDHVPRSRSCSCVVSPNFPASAPDEDLVEGSLLQVLTAMDDPRGLQGRRHCLPALMGLLIVALVCGCNTMCSVVEFGRNRRGLRRRLGFTHPKSPSQSTYNRLFEKLTISALQKAFGQWLSDLARLRAQSRPQTIASVDGKTLRGSGRHVLHAFAQDVWLLLDLWEVGEKQNELSGFESHLDQMLAKYPCLSLLTFDALFTQHTVARRLTQNGKKAIFQVKDNQKETLRSLTRFFHSVTQLPPDHQTRTKKK